MSQLFPSGYCWCSKVGVPDFRLEGEIRLAVMAGESIICWDEVGVPTFWRYIASEIERLILEENLAFEFSDGVVRRRGRRHTEDKVTRAHVVMGDSRLNESRKHYTKALNFFRNPTAPDYENCVKEAVCAVEAAGKALFPASKAATLGDLAKWFLKTND